MHSGFAQPGPDDHVRALQAQVQMLQAEINAKDDINRSNEVLLKQVEGEIQTLRQLVVENSDLRSQATNLRARVRNLEVSNTNLTKELAQAQAQASPRVGRMGEADGEGEGTGAPESQQEGEAAVRESPRRKSGGIDDRSNGEAGTPLARPDAYAKAADLDEVGGVGEWAVKAAWNSMRQRCRPPTLAFQ